MDPLESMELPAEVRALLRNSMANYQRYARVRMRIDTVNGREVWCSTHQYERAPNGMVLSDADLLVRGSEVFAPLRMHGYFPILSVYTLQKGPPEKPIAKHRMAGDIELHGQRCAVLRQTPPRMVFGMGSAGLHVLASEHHDPEARHEQFAAKAEQYRKRDHYRRGAGDT